MDYNVVANCNTKNFVNFQRFVVRVKIKFIKFKFIKH